MSLPAAAPVSLGRLSFWLPRALHEAFSEASDRRLLPVLREGGWTPSGPAGRPAAPGVVSRLYAFESAAALAAAVRRLRRGAGFAAAVAEVSAALAPHAGAPLGWRAAAFRVTAGPGWWREAGAGLRQGLWHTLGVQDGLPAPILVSVLQARTGVLWLARHGVGVTRYDGADLVCFGAADGLTSDSTLAIAEGAKRALWIGTGRWEGTDGEGVVRYDGTAFEFYGVEDGPASNRARALLVDRAGRLWVGTGSFHRAEDAGLSRFDGRAWTTVTRWDGLPLDRVLSVLADRQGRMWLGTYGEGACRWDGRRCETFTVEDGLANGQVPGMVEDRDGCLWLATWSGLSRYDGAQFRVVTVREGLADNGVMGLAEDGRGHVWCTTWRGLCRCDGERFESTCEVGGLPAAAGRPLCGRDGRLWFGTFGGGVSCYDGTGFTALTQAHGLALDWVTILMEDRQGRLWVGTFGGGVSCYDGCVVQSLCRQDGLSHDSVQAVLEDRRGDFWVATEGGVTRYRPGRSRPRVRLVDVVADRRYDPGEAVHVPVSHRLIAFRFRGSSLGTRPAGMAYVVRLLGHDEAWRPAYAQRVEYQDLPVGEYVFEVRDVDRDLNDSEPARVGFSVVPDPRLRALAQALGGGSDASWATARPCGGPRSSSSR